MPVREQYSLRGKRVWVTGHCGMVGGALVRRLATEGCQLLSVARKDLDLRDQSHVEDWMAEHKPQVIITSAATVGGILANDTRPGEFLYDNAAIELNVIEAARRQAVEKLLFISSACIYPRDTAQPIAEEALLIGPLEPTNQWYSIAKILGIMMCQAYRRQYGCDFISATPANVFGIGDSFDLESAHVIPALMRRAHEAKMRGLPELVVWGSGKPRREFMFVDDMADALVFLVQHYSGELSINVGIGGDVSIGAIAEAVAAIVGYEGRLTFDTSKPDGMPRKLLNSSRLAAMGWKPKTAIEDGLRQTYEWFLADNKT
jgi:GDP-L-fucose synthase